MVPSIKDKIEIIPRLKKGESGQTLAIEFSVGQLTITGMKNNPDSFTRETHNLDSEAGCSNIRTKKKEKI